MSHDERWAVVDGSLDLVLMVQDGLDNFRVERIRTPLAAKTIQVLTRHEKVHTTYFELQKIKDSIYSTCGFDVFFQREYQISTRINEILVQE